MVEEEAEEESRGLEDYGKDLWKGSSLLQYFLRLLESFHHVERRRQAANLKDSEVGRKTASEMPQALL